MTNKYSIPGAAKDVFQAVMDEDIANLRFFFADGADIDLRNDAGMTLLHVAVNNGKEKSAALLLGLGADPNLHGGPAGYSALHFAAYKDRSALAKLLIEHGAELERTDGQFMTPLQGAAFMGHLEVCKVLAEAGADVARKDAFGHTPAQIAQQRAGEDWDRDSRRFIITSVYLLSVERNGIQAVQAEEEKLRKQEEAKVSAAQHNQVEEDIKALRRRHPERFKLKPPGHAP